MKDKFLVGCLLLGLAAGPVSAASSFYVNDGVVLCPPQIPPQVDATNFVNSNYFSINFTNFFSGSQQYATDNTRNFTNIGTMVGNSGFRFDWFDTVPVVATHKMAANFVNSGTISAGSGINTNNFFSFFLQSQSLPKLLISATNVSLRSSTNIVGVDGLFSLAGKRVDLNRATIMLEGFEENPDSLFQFIDPVGIRAAYWGVGTNTILPAANFETSPPFTPFSQVTIPNLGTNNYVQLRLPGAQFYVDESIFGTNRTVQAVFLLNTNASITNLVYFPFNGFSVVEWLGRETNQVSGEVTTNHLYLTDDFGSFATNTVVTNFSYYTAVGTAIPINYSFSRFNPFVSGLGTPTAPSSTAGVFIGGGVVTNEYAAYGALFSASTVDLSLLPPAGRYITNLPGRLEITADATLDLTLARITGLNYLGLKATNHVLSTSGAKISVPFSDINLGTTNGLLALTNILYPTVQRFTGEVDLWSGRWTNNGGGLQTIYSVLFVDSKLSATAPSQIQDLTLRSTNIVISDVLNVTRNLLLDAERVTLTTNQQPAPTLRGELNLLSSAIIWPTVTPRLQYLTNNGGFSTLNAVFFGGSRTSPFFSSNYNEPYIAFVNRGQVSSEGSLIWANYFENTGQFTTGLGQGSIALQSVDTRLTNGSFLAINGDVAIATGSLTVTNLLLQAGRTLTLSATNFITDTGSSNANSWAVGRGFSFPVVPATGDLLGTTISETAPPGVENFHSLAGADRGVSVSGFSNNLALGRLLLNGGNAASLFTFAGAGTSNALYVDYLGLVNAATNINASGDLALLQIDPNLVIYYAQAVAGGISVAERINNANGGRLRWVPTYAGIYSSTNLVYPDGSTNTFNAALVQSQNLDSDGDGLVNAVDPTPIFRPQDVVLAVVITNQPSLGALISWPSVPGSTNTVFYKPAFSVASWLPLTNVVLGPFANSVRVFDPLSTNGSRCYRVQISVPKP